MPESPFYHYNASFDAIGTIQRHAVPDLKPDPDYLTNFLGVKIATRYFPGILDGKEGVVEPIPIPANWHADIAEWAYALRAVDMAQNRFCIVELGCGWGCWLNNTGAAARRRGLALELTGIEGDKGHVGFALESLEANGFSSDQFRIVHGVAAPKRAKALFPLVDNPAVVWGSEPIFAATPEQMRKAERKGGYQILDAYPLSDLSRGQRIDLLHIDIQGGEADFVKANFDDIDSYVSRMLIGTQPRVIEGDIIQFMLDKGWELEMDRPCIFQLVDGRPLIAVDGVQGWTNRKTPHEPSLARKRSTMIRKCRSALQKARGILFVVDKPSITSRTEMAGSTWIKMRWAAVSTDHSSGLTRPRYWRRWTRQAAGQEMLRSVRRAAPLDRRGERRREPNR